MDTKAEPAAPKVAVVVASTGRPEELGQLLIALEAQTRRADQIVLSLNTPQDAPADIASGVEVVFGPKGSCVQRNTAMARVEDGSDLIFFLDDDYLPSVRMIENAVQFFDCHQDIAACNGTLIADGINGPGISYGDALRLIEEHDRNGESRFRITADLDGLYGCNMVFRTSAVFGIRFDERLPLYGWQEDIDFAARLEGGGRRVKTDAFFGVHRGVKRSRSSGLRLGYSQVVNPVYLARKKTMRWSYAFKITRNNVLANMIRSFTPEPWVDRRGRLRGNLLGILHLLQGQIDPSRILDMK